VRIGLPQHAKGPWRRNQDQRLRLPCVHRGIEATGKRAQESLFLLRMPVGLLHRAAGGAERIQGAARRVGSQFTRFRVRMLVNFPGPEIEEFIVADILKHQSLLAVADDDPVALPDFELLHAIPIDSD